MSLFPETDITKGWGQQGTEGGPFASFFNRYFNPLKRFAMIQWRLNDYDASELASGFLLRELERESAGKTPLFQQFNPLKGRFRNLLAKTYWRYCRDEIYRGKKRAESLPESWDGEEGASRLEDLVAREFLNTLRAEVTRSLEKQDEIRLFDLRWPKDLALDPATNSEIMQTLNMTRGRLRVINNKIADALIAAMHRHFHNAGVNAQEARELIGSYCEVLDRHSVDS